MFEMQEMILKMQLVMSVDMSMGVIVVGGDNADV